MRKLFPYFMGAMTLVWIIGGTVWYKNNFCHNNPTTPLTAPIVAIKEGTQTIKHNAPFFFPIADSRPIFLSESIPVLKKTVDYLNQNLDKSLVIKGVYSSKEKVIKPNTNIGLYRADAIKTVLTGLGADAKSISLESEVSDELHFDNNQLTDGIRFEFVESDKVVFQALNLYFPEQRYRFAESKELETYFRNLAKFLVVNPRILVNISAHTSNTEGVVVAKNRLSYIQAFLEKRNFDLSRFHFINKTAKAPITKERSIKNQRIEIRLASM